MSEKTISLEYARRVTGPRAFNLMIKPVGSLCNLDCSYCYYLEKSAGRGRMSLEETEKIIRQYIEACEVPVCNIIWHGGEPLSAGLDYFRRVMEIQKKYAGGKGIKNTIQTNGTLLTQEWAEFFHDNDFLVGISIDGPESVHDRFRLYRDGRSSLRDALRGVENLNKSGVEYNILAAVSKASEGKGEEIYCFLKNLGTRFIQFSPVVEHIVRTDGARGFRIVGPEVGGAELAPWSVGAGAFGRFLCDIFERWASGDVGKVFVNYFDATLANWCGVMPGICSFARTCGDNSIVEENGDVFPCDHFVYPEYRLGNIFEDRQSLSAMMDSGAQLGFGAAKRDNLPRECLECDFLNLCNGGCPKHRFVGPVGEKCANYLCEGYKLFYSFSSELMKEFKKEICK